MSNLFWTKPYHGVQHLRGHVRLDSLPRHFQVTVSDYQTFATLGFWVRDPKLGGLKPHGDQQTFDTPELARAHGEAWFKARI